MARVFLGSSTQQSKLLAALARGLDDIADVDAMWTSTTRGFWGILSQMDKQTFLAEIRATHEPLAAVVAALPDDAWAEMLPDMAGWTRKDALAHVGWWSDHSVRVITALRAGGVPYERDPDFDIHAQNRSILEEFRDRGPEAVRA